MRAAMVADPCEYTWSSHRCHGAGLADPILDSFPEWEQLGRTEPERRARWRRKVRGEQPTKELDGVRSAAQWPALRCRGLGRDHFPSPRHRPRAAPSWSSVTRKDALTPEFSPGILSDTGILPPVTPEFARPPPVPPVPVRDGALARTFQPAAAREAGGSPTSTTHDLIRFKVFRVEDDLPAARTTLLLRASGPRRVHLEEQVGRARRQSP